MTMQQQFNNNFDHELGWEDEISKDATEFVQLTPGDYQFKVTNFERGRHTPRPGGKLPECPKAIITIQIETAEGIATLTHNLFLHTSTEGMLSAFFGAIGQKKHGQSLHMNWNSILGATGVCRVGKRKGMGDYSDREFDNIKSMIYAEDVDWTKVLNANAQPQQPAQQQYQQPQQPQAGYAQPQAQQQAPQQPNQLQNNGGFQPGMF